MNGFTKILFWMLTIGLGFVNPLISVAMVVLYYLPGIIQDICKPCSESQEEYEMNSFSEDVAANVPVIAMFAMYGSF